MSDIPHLKALHKEWFPIPYRDTFFRAILEKEVPILVMEMRLKTRKNKIFTCIVGCIVYKYKSAKRKYQQMSFFTLK